MRSGIQQAVAAAPQLRSLLESVGGWKGVAGHIVGMGEGEVRAGVPAWAWLLIGAAAGGIGVWLTRDRLEKLASYLG